MELESQHQLAHNVCRSRNSLSLCLSSGVAMSRPLAACLPEPHWSQDRVYRYELRRLCIPNNATVQRDTVNFILLNPSTADRQCNDPTVANCEQFASQWGYRNLIVTNLFAYVDSDPAKLKKAKDPVGPCNDRYLIAAARKADLRIAAWGEDGLYQDRATWLRVQFFALGLDLKMLCQNKDYSPRHASPQALRGERNFAHCDLTAYDFASVPLKTLLGHLRKKT